MERREKFGKERARHGGTGELIIIFVVMKSVMWKSDGNSGECTLKLKPVLKSCKTWVSEVWLQ